MLELPGCHRAFSCAEDDQCNLDGIAGTCESDGSCSFPDASCDSGRRYGQHASIALAGACVDEAIASTTDFDVTAGSSESGEPCESYETLVSGQPGLVLWHRMEEEEFGPALDSAQRLDGQYHDASGDAELDFGIPGPGGTGNAVRFHTAATPGGSGLRLNARVRGEIGSFVWFEGTPYTIELWYREHGMADGASPLLTVERYLELGFRFRIRHDTRLLHFSGWPPHDSNDDLVVDAGSFGEWHHVVVTVEPSAHEHRVRLYLDGDYAAERVAVWTVLHQCDENPCPVAGFVGSGQGQHADLEIDEFAVYDGVLSSETIAAHERAGRSGCLTEE
jgi:hypothetical protein